MRRAFATSCRRRGCRSSTRWTFRSATAVKLDAGLRLDLFIGERIVVELKAVEETLPVHEAQLLTCMKLTGSRLGFLVNFNVARLKDGLSRRVLQPLPFVVLVVFVVVEMKADS